MAIWDQFQTATVLKPNVGDINRTFCHADSYFNSLQVDTDGRLNRRQLENSKKIRAGKGCFPNLFFVQHILR